MKEWKKEIKVFSYLWDDDDGYDGCLESPEELHGRQWTEQQGEAEREAGDEGFSSNCTTSTGFETFTFKKSNMTVS